MSIIVDKDPADLIWPDDFINKVICGDCLEVMKKIPDGAVDLAVTSPPYNTGGSSCNKRVGNFYKSYADNLSGPEYKSMIDTSLSHLSRCCRYTAFNVQILSGNKTVLIQCLAKWEPHLKDIFVWKKQAVAQVNRGRMATGFEIVLMLGEDNSPSQARGVVLTVGDEINIEYVEAIE